MAGTSYVLISFHNRDVLISALSAVFLFGSGFRLFCVRLAVRYSVSGSLIKEVVASAPGNEYNGSV